MTDVARTVRNWSLQRDAEGRAWLAIDKPGTSVNVLSQGVMLELQSILAELRADPPRGLIIHSGKPGTFIAGADINEFPAIESAEMATAMAGGGQAILAALESLPCPSVAVLDGSTLGGGLELALAATWRIAVESDKPCIGLPEVNLGLHPGFGGTVRAVQLVGVRQAMPLMLTGRSLTPAAAARIGLVDATCPADGWRDAAAKMLGRPSADRRRPGIVDRLLGSAPVRGFLARSMAQQARPKAHPDHYPAPYAMIDLWHEHGARGTAAYEAEARSFGNLAVTPTSRNLVRVFFLQDRLRRLGGSAGDTVRRVHVVGAGVMGGDIAAWCALRGLDVTLQDRELRFVEPALARAAALFEKKVADKSAREATMRRLAADVEGRGVADADLVVEAIFEDLRAKQELFRTLEQRCRPGCVLATNTSSIPLEEIATSLQAPGRLIGLHFFNPVAKLPLVEVVRSPATGEASLAAGLAFVRQIGKLPVPCRSYPGFLVNRILAPYLDEAMLLAEERVPLPEIDFAATEFGMPVGPVELADSVGLDIALHVAQILSPVLKRPVSPVLGQMVKAGNLGQKSGRGFYLYQEGRPVKPRQSARMVRREIQDRLVFALLNEAAQCLAEGIVADADLVDAGVIFGTGFAPFRGGALHYARQTGVEAIVARLSELALQHGPRFRPSPGWERLREA